MLRVHALIPETMARPIEASKILRPKSDEPGAATSANSTDETRKPAEAVTERLKATTTPAASAPVRCVNASPKLPVLRGAVEWDSILAIAASMNSGTVLDHAR